MEIRFSEQFLIESHTDNVILRLQLMSFQYLFISQLFSELIQFYFSLLKETTENRKEENAFFFKRSFT